MFLERLWLLEVAIFAVIRDHAHLISSYMHEATNKSVIFWGSSRILSNIKQNGVLPKASLSKGGNMLCNNSQVSYPYFISSYMKLKLSFVH